MTPSGSPRYPSPCVGERSPRENDEVLILDFSSGSDAGVREEDEDSYDSLSPMSAISGHADDEEESPKGSFKPFGQGEMDTLDVAPRTILGDDEGVFDHDIEVAEEDPTVAGEGGYEDTDNEEGESNESSEEFGMALQEFQEPAQSSGEYIEGMGVWGTEEEEVEVVRTPSRPYIPHVWSFESALDCSALTVIPEEHPEGGEWCEALSMSDGYSSMGDDQFGMGMRNRRFRSAQSREWMRRGRSHRASALEMAASATLSRPMSFAASAANDAAFFFWCTIKLILFVVLGCVVLPIMLPLALVAAVVMAPCLLCCGAPVVSAVMIYNRKFRRTIRESMR